MGNEKTNSSIKKLEEDKERTNNFNKQLETNKVSNKKCRKCLSQKKRILKKEDGRYLIYYEF